MFFNMLAFCCTFEQFAALYHMTRMFQAASCHRLVTWLLLKMKVWKRYTLENERLEPENHLFEETGDHIPKYSEPLF